MKEMDITGRCFSCKERLNTHKAHWVPGEVYFDKESGSTSSTGRHYCDECFRKRKSAIQDKGIYYEGLSESEMKALAGDENPSEENHLPHGITRRGGTVDIKELDVREKPDFDLPQMDEIRRFFPFLKMRKYQDTALRILIGAMGAGYKYIVLEAPTGFGKSGLAVALAKWFEEQEKNSYIIVASKYLQDQYLQDFRTVSVKGRGNFDCIQKKKHTCETAQLGGVFRCRHIPSPSKEGENKTFVGTSAKRGELRMKKGVEICPYWKQKCKAMQHSFPLFNYEYFLHETQFVGDFGKRDLIVCDEAHNIESKLMRFIGFEISQNDLEAMGATVPGKEANIRTWRNLLEEWRDLFQERVEKLEGKKDITPLELEKLEEMRHKVGKCDFLADELDENPELWVVSVQTNFYKGRLFKKIVFKPVGVRKWSGHIFSKGEAFLLQSATIINPKTLCESLAIEGEVLYLKVPSTFPPKSRLFYYQGVGKMSRNSKEKTMPALVKRVESIINNNPKEKGVIHTHTYSIMREISRGIQNPRIVFNEGSFSRDEIFDRFKNSKEPLVLITPSAYEGVDFKGDMCRWQVLCKVPYPDLGDLQVKKRMEQDREWYTWLTALRIVQTYGRGMRTPDDFCRTYILDSNFKDFYIRNRKFFPEWFQDIVRWGNE